MFKLNLLVGALLVSTSALAGGILDGKSYCRTIVSDGSFGQPKGKRSHCISFANGVATDGANSFFGNPPERVPYEVNGLKVSFGGDVYVLSPDKKTLTTVKGSTVEGTVLKLQKASNKPK